MNRIWLQRSFIRVCSLPLVEFNVFDVNTFHDNYKKERLGYECIIYYRLSAISMKLFTNLSVNVSLYL